MSYIYRRRHWMILFQVAFEVEKNYYFRKNNQKFLTFQVTEKAEPETKKLENERCNESSHD